MSRPLSATAAVSAALLLSLSALPAAATLTYGVATLAAVNDFNLMIYTQAGYNATYSYLAGGVVWDPAAGATGFSSTCSNCSAVSGTTPTGSNPDAHTAVSASKLDLFPDVYPDTHGTAYAAASLGKGSLGVSATGQRRQTGQPVLEGTDGYAVARLWDTLTFHVAGATASTHTVIPVSFVVDGVYAPSALEMASMSFWFDLGASHAFGSSSANGFTNGNAPGNWINPQLVWTGSEQMTFTAGYELVGEDTEVGLLMQMLTLGGFGSADFSHTAAVSFDLPSNVTLTSASGVFLSDTGDTGGGGGGGGGNVPEPPALALLGAALLGLRWSRRRV